MEFWKLFLLTASTWSILSSPEEEEFHNSSIMDHLMSRCFRGQFVFCLKVFVRPTKYGIRLFASNSTNLSCATLVVELLQVSFSLLIYLF